jgi:hypothetical protein
LSDDINRLSVEWVVCGYCGADFGTWCKTKNGHRASYLHAHRTWLLRHVFHQGMEFGTGLAAYSEVQNRTEQNPVHDQYIDLLAKAFARQMGWTDEQDEGG